MFQVRCQGEMFQEGHFASSLGSILLVYHVVFLWGLSFSSNISYEHILHFATRAVSSVISCPRPIRVPLQLCFLLLLESKRFFLETSEYIVMPSDEQFARQQCVCVLLSGTEMLPFKGFLKSRQELSSTNWAKKTIL